VARRGKARRGIAWLSSQGDARHALVLLDLICRGKAVGARSVPVCSGSAVVARRRLLRHGGFWRGSRGMFVRGVVRAGQAVSVLQLG